MSAQHTPGPWAFDGVGRVDAVQFRRPTGHLLDDGSEYIGGLVALPYECGEGTHEANARLIAASPDLLAELRAAHVIIRNALNLMTTEQKANWAGMNERAGVAGEGATRAHEREAVIKRAEGL